MILTVAIISPATTGLNADKVAKVTASSIKFRQSIAVLSTTSTPGLSASRLARPVKARSTRTPSPATAAAISAAASSSDTSPGSSRATTISATPAARSAAISAGPTTVPFLSTTPALRIECTAMPPSASPTGTGPNFIAQAPSSRRFPWRLRAHPQPRRDLAHDRDRDLGRRHRGNVQADRRMNAPERFVADALPLQPLNPTRVRLLRAERADIEAVARQRMRERRIVDLGIVRERDERRVVIDAQRRQRFVRPLRDHLDVRKALVGRERGARIDDDHIVAQNLGDRRQRLADMDGAGDHKPRRRHVHGEKDFALRRFFHAALAAADVLLEQVFQRIARDIGALDQTLLAARNVSDHNRGAPRRPLGVERFENLELHGPVPCFRSSSYITAPLCTNFGSKGALATL